MTLHHLHTAGTTIGLTTEVHIIITIYSTSFLPLSQQEKLWPHVPYKHDAGEGVAPEKPHTCSTAPKSSCEKGPFLLFDRGQHLLPLCIHLIAVLHMVFSYRLFKQISFAVLQQVA